MRAKWLWTRSDNRVQSYQGTGIDVGVVVPSGAAADAGGSHRFSRFGSAAAIVGWANHASKAEKQTGQMS